jgi:hypothetical protein
MKIRRFGHARRSIWLSANKPDSQITVSFSIHDKRYLRRRAVPARPGGAAFLAPFGTLKFGEKEVQFHPEQVNFTLFSHTSGNELLFSDNTRENIGIQVTH